MIKLPSTIVVNSDIGYKLDGMMLWVEITVFVFVLGIMMLASTPVSHASFWDDLFGKGSNSSTPATTTPLTSTESSVSPVSSHCDPSYPDFCIAPPPPDLNCPDIPQKGFTVTGSDPHGFDRAN